MLIIPAIDLYNGKVVRLTEGDYGMQKMYDVEFAEMLDKYESSGISLIHIVDLNGAKGDNSFENFISKTIANRKIKMQIGGGVRDIRKFKFFLDIGVERIILGTAAITKPEFLQSIVNENMQSKTVIGVDIKNFQIMINGWKDAATINLYIFIENCLRKKFTTFLCTDITKDGKLEGSSTALYKELKMKFPEMELIASGGVSGMDDIKLLDDTGVASVVVGKAIYENCISLEQVSNWNGKQKFNNN